MKIAFLLYDRLTALDAIGPYEVLSRLPGASVDFLARKAGEVRVDTGVFGLTAGRSLADVPHPDVIVVPGGAAGTFAAARDEEILSWVREAHARSTWTTSVCTGSLILGAAGILAGVRATTHWAAKAMLEGFGAKFTPERVVREGKIVTAAGVSSGIDMGLTLAGEIAGPEAARAIQLAIEYDPEPPFDAGSPEKAGERIVELALADLQKSL